MTLLLNGILLLLFFHPHVPCEVFNQARAPVWSGYVFPLTPALSLCNSVWQRYMNALSTAEEAEAGTAPSRYI